MSSVPAYAMRSAMASEYAELYALHREAMGDYVEATWGAWVHEIQREFFDVRMAGGSLLVITVDDATAGLLEFEQSDTAITVLNLELRTAFQRRGIGSHILQSFLARGAQIGLPVELTVLKVNPARRLYERLGFAEYQESGTHYYMRWTPAGAGTGDTP